MTSPLGVHAETVAAVVAVFTVAAAIASRPLGFQDAFLDSLAALSIGAVFGSTATANGVKASHQEVVAKLDTAAAIAAVTTANGHGNGGATVAAQQTAVAAQETAQNTAEIAEHTDPGTKTP